MVNVLKVTKMMEREFVFFQQFLVQ